MGPFAKRQDGGERHAAGVFRQTLHQELRAGDDGLHQGAETVVVRLQRGRASGRSDDQDLATIQNRLDTYRRQSEPCISYYEGRGTPVLRIDGVGTIGEVTARILGALGLA